MSYKTYYNIGSFILVIFCMGLFALIVWPFAQAESSTQLKKRSLEDQARLRDELRMHRDLYLRVATSSNPIIQDEVKTVCKQSIDDLNEKIYSNNNVSPEEEIELRKKIKEVNIMLSEKLYLQNIPVSVQE